MVRRYGEHASDELHDKMKSLPFKEFKRYAWLEYFDSRLDKMIDDMIQAAVAAHRASKGPQPEPTPGKVVAPSGRMFVDPDVGVREALEALSILIAAGIAAGFAPAQRALMVSPVVALRSE